MTCQVSYYNNNGLISSVFWSSDIYEFNKEDQKTTSYRRFDRLSGPSHIYYYLNGNISSKRYICDGKLHRCIGPAYIECDMTGFIRYVAWYINDYEITEDVNIWLEENNIDWQTWSTAEQLLFMIKFG